MTIITNAPLRGMKFSPINFIIDSIENLERVSFAAISIMISISLIFGIIASGISLWSAMMSLGNIALICIAIDRILFVLMLVEILNTVRHSFKSGALLCEPFLVVGIIASIRRILSITIQSSQDIEQAREGALSQEILYYTVIEMAVLAGLIFVMVASIYILRGRSLQKEANAAS
jgi:uncharacterized membrane protein (DUF373 family)